MVGPLPPPNILAAYSLDQQERILRMAESSTTDESVRRDRITEASIKESVAGRKGFIGLASGALLCALITEGVFHSTVTAVAFLAAPVFSTFAQLLGKRSASGNKKRKQESDGA